MLPLPQYVSGRFAGMHCIASCVHAKCMYCLPTELVKSGTEALVTLTNPGLSMGSAAAGNAMDIVRDAVDGDGNPVNGSKPTAAAGGGSSKASIDAAQQKADAEKWIETLTKELAETSEPAKKRELQKKLDDWKEAADR